MTAISDAGGNAGDQGVGLQALRAHLLAHSVRTGDFVLKSGRKSTWFIDSKQTVCRPDGMLLLAEAILGVLPDDATAIGGLTMGADPVAFIAAGVAATRDRGGTAEALLGAEGVPFRALFGAPDLGFDYDGP